MASAGTRNFTVDIDGAAMPKYPPDAADGTPADPTTLVFGPSNKQAPLAALPFLATTQREACERSRSGARLAVTLSGID
jgi:hypothetical protein